MKICISSFCPEDHRLQNLTKFGTDIRSVDLIIFDNFWNNLFKVFEFTWGLNILDV